MRIKLCVITVIAIICLTCAAASAAAPAKPWTILIYMNSDNNLDPYGQKNLQQMASVGSNDFFNIVVLCDRRNAPASLIYVEKNNLKVLKNLGEIDMGNVGTLINFAKENIAAFPADHYILEIWNHGQGWRNPSEQPIYKWISQDESSGNHITVEDLGHALSEIKNFLGKKLDVLAYDACLMQMVEVACSIKGNADYIMGSEESIPGNGFPYDTILENFKPGMSTIDLCKMWIDSYVHYYATTGDKTTPATLSLLDDNQLAALQASLDEFAKIAMEGTFNQQIKNALVNTQRYRSQQHKDLGDLLVNLKKEIADSRFSKAILDVGDAYSRAVIYSNFNNYFMKAATGMSIYFPETKADYDPEYDICAYSKISIWHEMLKKYLAGLRVDQIIERTISGDLSELRSFVQNDAKHDSLTANLLIEKLNFEAFSEHVLNGSLSKEVSNLIREIK
ncbi:MAG: hypothetical protein HQM08_07965 [Candidatus Riflebacteria bacterium]|nr:hypothetical protein [Candidatus Riflebacteria bacterium]